MKLKVKNRKETYKKSSKKRAETLKNMGMVSLNTYVKIDVKERLHKIQDDKGYRLIGDAIEDMVELFHGREINQ